jgi:hypothetical protein
MRFATRRLALRARLARFARRFAAAPARLYRRSIFRPRLGPLSQIQ